MKLPFRCFALAALALFSPAKAADAPRLQAWKAQQPSKFTVLVRGTQWTVPAACLPQRQLGSDAAGRDMGAASAGRELGSDAAGRDLGSAAGGRDLGAASAGRDLGSNSAGRDLGSAAAGRELGSDVAGRDLGSAAAGRDLGSDAGGRDLGAASAGRDLGAASADRDLGSDVAARDLGALSDSLVCELAEDGVSTLIRGVPAGEFALPEGSQFKRFGPGAERNSVLVIQ